MENDANPESRVIQITYWQADGVQRLLTASAHCFIGLMEDGRTVLKYPFHKNLDSLISLREEADRYARVGPHENLVTCNGLNPDGFLLLEYCEQGDLLHVIEGPVSLTDDQKTNIGKQIIRCLVHLHKQNFIHCDIHVRNVFLTSDMVAKVGDLQGQLYRQDGSIEMETMSQENVKSRHPFAGEDEFSKRTEIFALGTLLYHLWRGHEPFPELEEHRQEESIQQKYRAGQYPIDVKHAAGIDALIVKCWTSKYEEMSEVLDDMESLSQ
jgi:serine/threonine protein kinase